MLSAIVDRPRNDAALAVGATWLVFMAGLAAGGDLGDPVSFAIAGGIGAALIYVGFVAASRCRVLSGRPPVQRARLAVWSLAAGVALGLANLAANLTIANADPRLRALLTERMATIEPLEALVASPIAEEIAVRLFLMSAIAWVIFRVTKSTRAAFAVALAGSALVFAALHLGRPFPDDPAFTNYYRATLLTKYTVAGLPVGWVFWRWGLPYAILCHVAANGAHLALQAKWF